MSVTFFLKGAPQIKYQPDPEDQPDWWSTTSAPGYPEINMSNLNAGALLRCIGAYTPELTGEWDSGALHIIV